MRVKSEVVKFNMEVKRLELNDWIGLTIDLSRRVAEFKVWPSNGTAPVSASFDFGAVLAEKYGCRAASAAAANGVTTEGEEGEVGVGLGLGPYAAELVRKSQRLVMRSALKLVHLLAAQVARSDETEVEAAGAGGELESVGLVKVASGPETLSKEIGRAHV